MTLAAALAIGATVGLLRPSGGWLVRSRLGLARDEPSPRPAVTWRWAAVPLGVAGLVVVVVLPGPSIVLGLTGLGLATFVVRQVRAGRRAARARRRRTEVVEAVGLMAAELRAGMLAPRVLAGLAPEFGFLAPAARAAERGSDVAAVLRASSAAPGAGLLADLAGAWVVADRAGAPLALVLDRLAETARDDLEIEREVRSGAAPARATGRLMAVLPAFGLALGAGMGGDPVAVLTGTLPGALCLAAGVALACVGVAWIDRIVDRAEAEQ